MKDKLKQLSEQEEYNLRDGLSVQLHGYALKKLGLDWNTLDTDKSNEISEICDDVIEQMHDELKVRLINWSDEDEM